MQEKGIQFPNGLFNFRSLCVLPVTESTFSHNSCQTSPTPPHNLPTWYVNEFLVDSKTKKAEPRTKMALKKAPFKVENNEVLSSCS